MNILNAPTQHFWCDIQLICELVESTLNKALNFRFGVPQI